MGPVFKWRGLRQLAQDMLLKADEKDATNAAPGEHVPRDPKQDSRPHGQGFPAHVKTEQID